jgi:hypothetical protein
MHFIKDLLGKPMDSDPIKNIPQVHRHFMRYSKGEFEGPSMVIKISKTNITVNGSFEFEDLCAWIAGKCMPDSIKPFNITGSLISGNDFSNNIQKLGIDWKVKKSTGQTKNFKTVLKPADKAAISKDQLVKLIENLNSDCYILLNFKAGEPTNFTLTTAKNPPRPKTKGGTEEEEAKEQAARIKFTSLKIPFSEDNLKLLINEAVPDYKDEISSKVKVIEVTNSYTIQELILPPKEKVTESSQYRTLTLRKGILKRKIVIDGKKFSKDIPFKI